MCSVMDLIKSDTDWGQAGVAEASYEYPLLQRIMDGQNATGRYTVKANSITVKATHKVATVTLNKAADADYEVKVSDSFTMSLNSYLAGAKLTYYKDGVDYGKAIVNNDDNIFPYVAEYGISKDKDGNITKVKQGLAIELGKDAKAFKQYGSNGSGIALGDVTTIKAYSVFDKWPDSYDDLPANDNATYIVTKSASSMGEFGNSNSETNDVEITIKGLENGAGGEMTVEFTDEFGITTSAKINYVKEDYTVPTQVKE